MLAVVLALLGCSGDDDGDGATPTTARETSTTAAETTTTTTATPAEESLRLTGECTGVGEVADEGELTYLRDGRVWAAAFDGTGERCIAEYTGDARLAWGGDGDRLLAGERSVLLADGPSDVVGDDLVGLEWSRPTGKALVVRDEEGARRKLSLDGEPPVDLGTLPLDRSELRYHPAGTAIAAIDALSNNVMLVNNRGEDPRWLLASEVADDITDIAFSGSGDLVFVARHDDEWHLHRLQLGEEIVRDLLVASTEVEQVTPSEWDATAVAAARGTCDEPGPLYVQVGDQVRDFTGTAVERGRPVGWTPTGALVVLVGGGCGGDPTSTGDLYVVHTTEPVLVAEDVETAAVRAVLPPPPPPPPAIMPAPA